VINGVIVIQARLDALDPLHQQVGFGRMQTAAGGTGLLHDRRSRRRLDHGLRREHAVHQGGAVSQRQGARAVEVAAGGAALHQRFQRRSRWPRQGNACVRRTAYLDVRRWRAELAHQVAEGAQPGLGQCIGGIDVAPTAEGLQRRRQRMPVRLTLALVALAHGGMGCVITDQQAAREQGIHTLRSVCLGQRGAIHPSGFADVSQ
jgi:hypothetical protein